MEINCEEEKENKQNKQNKQNNKNKQSKKPILEKDAKIDNKIIEENNESDEVLEARFMKSLPKEKLKFFMFKASQIYNFLKSINLVRYIEIFIEDGFEDLESILGKLLKN